MPTSHKLCQLAAVFGSYIITYHDNSGKLPKTCFLGGGGEGNLQLKVMNTFNVLHVPIFQNKMSYKYINEKERN
jgi:hypothetical protein